MPHDQPISSRTGRHRWQCQGCGSRRVRDQILLATDGRLEIHRLICLDCGMVDHYDGERAAAYGPVTPVSKRFHDG